MKNTLYGIGLDIGVASVGWAVVGLNGTGEPIGLHRLGTHFRWAEQPKTGESLCRAAAHGARDAPPSAPQGAALRRADVYALLERSGLSTGKRSRKCLKRATWKNIYVARVGQALIGRRQGRIFAHFAAPAQRRGFKSNRRTASDGEDGGFGRCERKPPAHGPGRLAQTVAKCCARHEAFAL